jgi:hypothetical protein
VRLRPIPRLAQPPAIDDVAHQIDRQRIVVAQEVEQIIGLAAARSEMDVRYPDRPILEDGRDVVHGIT